MAVYAAPLRRLQRRDLRFYPRHYPPHAVEGLTADATIRKTHTGRGRAPASGVRFLMLPSVYKGQHACQRAKPTLAAFSPLVGDSPPSSCGLASLDVSSLAGPLEFFGCK